MVKMTIRQEVTERITRAEVVENQGQQGDRLHNQTVPSSDTSERTSAVLGASTVSALFLTILRSPFEH